MRRFLVAILIVAILCPVCVTVASAKVSDRVLAVVQAIGNNPRKAAEWLMTNLTTEQKLAFEAYMIPAPSDDEKLAALEQAKAQLERVKLSTDMSAAVAAIDAKIAEIEAAKEAEK